MIAAVLCVLLFSGNLAASEKSFGYGGQAAATTGEETAWSSGGQSGYTKHDKDLPEILPKLPLLNPVPDETASSSGDQSGQPKEETASVAAASTNKQAAGYGGGQPKEEARPQHPAPASGDEATPAADKASASGSAAASSSSEQAKYGLDPAGEPEYGLNQKAIDDIVREHNVFRAKEHVPPLTWNATLAKFSQEYAETKLKGECKMEHSTSPYGENLMQGAGGSVTWKTTVDEWSNEKKSYHYGSNTCDAGKMCGHYTAVVWKGTTTVGCGRVKCNNGDTMLMCSYWPPGNYDGEKPF